MWTTATAYSKLRKAIDNGDDADHVRSIIQEYGIQDEIDEITLSTMFGLVSRSLLGYAANQDRVNIVRLLVEEFHANPEGFDHDTHGNTPLINAVYSGKTAVVSYLVEELEVNINAKNHAGETAKYRASVWEYDSITEILENHQTKLEALEEQDDDLSSIVDALRAQIMEYESTLLQKESEIDQLRKENDRQRQEIDELTEHKTQTGDHDGFEAPNPFAVWFESNLRGKIWEQVQSECIERGLDDLQFWMDVVERDVRPTTDGENKFSLEYIFRDVLGIDNPKALGRLQRKLLEEKNLPSWLVKYPRLSQYLSLFEDEGIGEVDELVDVDDDYLKNLGVEKQGHRIRMLFYLQQARGTFDDVLPQENEVSLRHKNSTAGLSAM